MTLYARLKGNPSIAPYPRSDHDKNMIRIFSEKTGIGVSFSEDVDYEDWMEPFSLVMSAINSGFHTIVLEDKSLSKAMETPLAELPGNVCPDILIGRTLKNEEILDPKYKQLCWPRSVESISNDYIIMDAFKRHAGRKFFVSDMPGNERQTGSNLSIENAIHEFRGHDCIIKQTKPIKSFPLVNLSVPKNVSLQECSALFWSHFEYQPMRFEGLKNSLLTQEVIPMRYETRFFVIDGKVITGAGCVESLTPMQNTNKDLFHNVMEKRRNSGELEESPDIMNILQLQAKSIASEIHDEYPELHAYTLDLAINGKTGQPVIIELNPATNAGLYAINTDALVSAIIEYSFKHEAELFIENDGIEDVFPDEAEEDEYFSDFDDSPPKAFM